jgi:Fe-S cluster biogenesis protein NfuA
MTITSILPTPNPNALKFVADRILKAEGNSNYIVPSQCSHNSLALEIFKLRGVDQIHIFQNTITITKFSYIPWEDLRQKIQDVLEKELLTHQPFYQDPDPEKERRAALSEELMVIEEILDRTIRPALQMDGGDLQCLSYQNHQLLIRYQGACGTCPSSSAGTLEAIKGQLRSEYDPEIEVIIAS